MQTENRVTWVFSVRRESYFSPGQVNSFILYAAMWLSSWFSLSLRASVAYLEAAGCRTQTALSCCAIATEACRPSGTDSPASKWVRWRMGRHLAQDLPHVPPLTAPDWKWSLQFLKVPRSRVWRLGIRGVPLRSPTLPNESGPAL